MARAREGGPRDPGVPALRGRGRIRPSGSCSRPTKSPRCRSASSACCAKCSATATSSADPHVAGCADPDIATRLEALQPAPPLSEPEEAERWLDQRARALPALPGLVPRAARTMARRRRTAPGLGVPDPGGRAQQARDDRRVGPGSGVAGGGGAGAALHRAHARSSFSPSAGAASTASTSPLSETLRRFEDASRRLEQEVALFFQQDKVKARVREWVDQGVETEHADAVVPRGEEQVPGGGERHAVRSAPRGARARQAGGRPERCWTCSASASGRRGRS